MPIKVYLVSLADAAGLEDALLHRLTERERNTLASVGNDMVRVRRLVSRTTLQMHADKYCSTGPGPLIFRRGKSRKLYIRGNPFRISLSYAGDLVAVAIASSPVGIDIEAQSPHRLDDISPFLSQTERKRVNSAPSPETELLRCWVGKEAVLKAIGIGFGLPHVVPETPPLQFRPVPLGHGELPGVRRFGLAELPMPQGYLGAVSAVGADWAVHVTQISVGDLLLPA